MRANYACQMAITSHVVILAACPPHGTFGPSQREEKLSLPSLVEGFGLLRRGTDAAIAAQELLLIYVSVLYPGIGNRAGLNGGSQIVWASPLGRCIP
jgi:hypothetical protein